MAPCVDDQFLQYRRRLPHWRLPGAVYFVTWRLHRNQPPLLPEDRALVVSSIEHFNGRRYEIAGYVVMDDHVHVLVAPHTGFRLEDHVSGWKSFSAHRMTSDRGRLAPVWQDEYFDRIVRDETELFEKMNYILNNPRKRWPELLEYRWLSTPGLPRIWAAEDGRPTRS